MNKFYRYLINFICLFYSREIRRKKREYYLLLPSIYKKNKQSKPSFKSFKKEVLKEPTVLIVEPNPYHFEILPSYVKYFQDIGYKVELIAQPEIESDSPFILYDNKSKIITLSPKYQKKALQLDKIKNYHFVFLSTSVLWADNVRDSYINFLGFEPNGKYGFLMVEHNVVPYNKQYKHDQYIQQNRLFTLAGQHHIPMLNPHYFGEVNISKKSEFTTFAAVVNENKNIDFLFTTVRSLIRKGISNFKIIVTGRSVITIIPDDLKDFIEVTGKLKFRELWDIYEKADFFLPFLNPEIGGHKRYLEGTVTGTWQSMMGFQTPVVIHKNFTEYYRLNDKNAVIYNRNEDLEFAIEKCINLTESQYQEVQSSINQLANDINDQSLDNLKFAIAQHKTNDT